MPKKSAVKSQRIMAYDLMRGFFLLVILINHLHRFPGFFDIFTGQAALWGSVAEGFFLISGLLIGKIQRPKIAKKSIKPVYVKFFKRALLIYAISVSLTVAFTIIGWYYLNNPGLKPGLYSGSFVSMLGQAASFRYIYGWADFLVYFAVYLLAVPLALQLMNRKMAWLVAIVSLVLFGWRNHSAYFIWQLYFFEGLVVGYYFEKITIKLKTQAARRKKIQLAVLLSLTGISLVASIIARLAYPLLEKHANFGIEPLGKIQSLGQFISLHTASIFDRWQVYGPGRVVIIGLWFWALYYLTTRFDQPIKRYLGWLLLPMGKNSFATYIIQSAVVFFCSLVFIGHDRLTANFAVNCLGIGLTLGLVFVFINIKRLIPGIISNRTRVDKATLRS